jgi:hypothetical protein
MSISLELYSQKYLMQVRSFPPSLSHHGNFPHEKSFPKIQNKILVIFLALGEPQVHFHVELSIRSKEKSKLVPTHSPTIS